MQMQQRMILFIILSLLSWMVINKLYDPGYGKGTEVYKETSASPAPEPARQQYRESREIGAAPRAERRQKPSPLFEDKKKRKGQVRLISVETDLYQIVLTSKGGRIAEAQLKQYTHAGNLRERLTSRRPDSAYLSLCGEAVDDRDIYYRTKASDQISLSAGEQKSVSFVYRSGRRQLTKEYVFYGDRYTIAVNVAVTGKERVEELTLCWDRTWG